MTYHPIHRIALALLALTGCQLVFDHGDDGDDGSCPPYAAEDLAPAQQLRNPQTGECQGFGNPYPCDDRCGYACPGTGAGQAQPDWGACYGECEQIVQSGASSQAQEAMCIAHPSCRAVYHESGDANTQPQFFDCWSVALSGPVKGVCDGLDAQQCSRHDDCRAVYLRGIDSPPFLMFSRCIAEVATPACTTVATEPACTARPDCSPVYRGEDCTCVPGKCECNVLTYTSCESK